MRETIRYPRHGFAPSGTLHRVQAGWAYGYPQGNLLTPALSAGLAQASAARFYGLGKGDTLPKAPAIDKTPSGPPVISATLPEKPATKEQAKAEAVKREAVAKARGVAERVHAAIAAGKLPAGEVARRAEQDAVHAEKLELSVHGAYNAIALLQAKISQAVVAGTPQAAHQRVLNKMRERTDALARAAARSAAAAEAFGAASGGESATEGMFYGFGQDDAPAADSYALEEEAAVAVADASNAVATDDLPAADKALDEAAVYQQQAQTARRAEAAAGDVFAQIEAALQPSAIPWKAIGVAAALLALARAVSR